MKKIVSTILTLGCCFFYGNVLAEVVVDAAGLKVDDGLIATDQLLIGDSSFGTIPADLWALGDNGLVSSCNAAGICTTHPDAGEDISAGVVFSGRLWIGQDDGTLKSCTASGNCSTVGNYGSAISAMAVYKGKLWIGQENGSLQVCNNGGDCTLIGAQGQSILAMAVFNNNLWIGQGGGTLKSCNHQGVCEVKAGLDTDILSMAIFNSKLWVGTAGGELQSCSGTDQCSSHGDKGPAIYAMAQFGNSLWIGHLIGLVQSCDTNGSCTSMGDQGGTIFSMISHKGRLWLGQSGGEFGYCDAAGNCYPKISLGETPNVMISYQPTSIGDSIFTSDGRVGIGIKNPEYTLDISGLVKIRNLPLTYGDQDLCLNTTDNLLSLCSSSKRYKENMEPLDKGLEEVLQFTPVTFQWKEGKKADIGFIAEEVEKIDPLLVTYNDEGLVEGVKYKQLSTVLVNAIKELKEENDTLETKLLNQQAMLEELQKRLDNTIHQLKKIER